METKLVMVLAEVLDEREIRGTRMYLVKIASKPNPIWVEEDDLADE